MLSVITSSDFHQFVGHSVESTDEDNVDNCFELIENNSNDVSDALTTFAGALPSRHAREMQKHFQNALEQIVDIANEMQSIQRQIRALTCSMDEHDLKHLKS